MKKDAGGDELPIEVYIGLIFGFSPNISAKYFMISSANLDETLHVRQTFLLYSFMKRSRCLQKAS